MATFNIVHQGEKPIIGYLAYNPSPAAAAVKGLAMGPHASVAAQCDLAQPTAFTGFLDRAVVTSATWTTMLKDNTLFPGMYAEMPYISGEKVGLVDPEVFDVAGSAYMALDSDTGALAANTALNTLISFTDGKLRVKQTNDIAFFTLQAHLGDDADGDFILRLKRI